MRYTEFKTILKEEASIKATIDYTVALGDTLGKIAKVQGVKLADLIAANKQIKNPDRIYPGDVITIPGASKVVPNIKKEKPPAKKQPSGKHEIRNVAAANEAFDFFKGNGLTDPQCAAFVGNINAESSFNTKIQNKAENAVGIVQWRLDRLRKLSEFAKKRRQDWHSLELQLDFIWHELTGKYKHVLAELDANKNNLEKCVSIVMNKYEVAKPISYPERLGYAESAMRLFSSATDKKSA
jgi:LysM repeat protein